MHGWTRTSHVRFCTLKKQSSLKNWKQCFAMLHTMALFSHSKWILPFFRRCNSTQKNVFFFLSLPLNCPHIKRSFCLCFQVPLAVIKGPELTKEMHQQILLFPLLGKPILHHVLQSLSKIHISISK